MTRAARVYVVDDDLHVLSALRRLLEASGYDVVTHNSANEFLARHDPALPGCVLLDIGMTELNGLETQQKMLELGVSRPIIFVTGYDDVRTSVEAMKSGAHDYLVKPISDKILLATVEAAVSSDLKAFREREDVAKLQKQWRSLTTREREVMLQVIRGRLNKQIAGDLNIAERTVKTHRAQLMAKLGAASASDLALLADERLRTTSRRA